MEEGKKIKIATFRFGVIDDVLAAHKLGQGAASCVSVKGLFRNSRKVTSSRPASEKALLDLNPALTALVLDLFPISLTKILKVKISAIIETSLTVLQSTHVVIHYPVYKYLSLEYSISNTNMGHINLTPSLDIIALSCF